MYKLTQHGAGTFQYKMYIIEQTKIAFSFQVIVPVSQWVTLRFWF